jgi:hypothetical protein
MTDAPLPNKCEYCGLRVQYTFRSSNETAESDQAFTNLRVLRDRKIIKPVFRRLVAASDDRRDFGATHFCAVSSSAWLKNDKPCSHWSLRIDGASIADYLSIYHNRRNYNLAKWAAIVAVIMAVLIAIFQAVTCPQ